MWTEHCRKGWRGKSWWLHQRESGQEVEHGPGGVTASPALLGPVLVWSQQNYLRLLKTVTYFESSCGCPRDPPERKSNDILGGIPFKRIN